MTVSPCWRCSASAVTVCSVASPAGTMIQTARGEASRATRSASDPAPEAPPRASVCTASALRSHTTTSWPPATRRRAMLPPIRPRPTRPSCMSFASFVDLANAGDVPAAFERRRQPHADDRERLGFRDGALAERQHVRVVVRAVPDGHLFAPADAAPDAADAVGHHRFAVAGAAEDDAPLELAARHRLGDRADEVGVIDGRLG